MAFDTPILLIVFNRPDQTRQLMARIRSIKPKHLFVAADGARDNKPTDAEKCELVRRVVMDSIDWECDLKIFFRDENVGCGLGPSQAITWFFDHVEQGIILEDDCLPSVSFFGYCEQLLGLYKQDERIMMVSGFNPLERWYDKHVDYFFTDGSIWGWATWKRAWAKFDFNLSSYQQLSEKKYLQDIVEHQYPQFIKAYDGIVQGASDAWDYQWHFARMINNGLSITPSVNLVENIGFDENATHTTWVHNPHKGVKAREIKLPLRINNFVTADKLFSKIVAEKEKTNPSFFKRLKERIASQISKK
jgi:hypothetical protein